MYLEIISGMLRQFGYVLHSRDYLGIFIPIVKGQFRKQKFNIPLPKNKINVNCCSKLYYRDIMRFSKIIKA